MGELALEIASAFLSDNEATEQSLHLMAEVIGISCFLPAATP